jgi:hypothetical protein
LPLAAAGSVIDCINRGEVFTFASPPDNLIW